MTRIALAIRHNYRPDYRSGPDYRSNYHSGPDYRSGHNRSGPDYSSKASMGVCGLQWRV